MSQKLLFIDLDRTLLDTQRFMHDLWTELARQYGANYEYEMSRVPHWYRSMGDYRYYDLRLHIEEGLGVPADDAVAAITPALQKNDYMYPDATSALTGWRELAEYEIRVLTFGPRWVQEFKLRLMPAIEGLPKDITLEEKNAFIAHGYPGAEGFLVDDKRNPDLPDGIREVWLDRDGTNLRPEGIITINSLTELRRIL